jgi:hypothetical protein
VRGRLGHIKLTIFGYLESLTTNNARRTREIKSRVAIAEAAFNKKNSFYQQIELKFKEESGKVLHSEHSLVWYRKVDTSESRSETPEKF